MLKRVKKSITTTVREISAILVSNNSLYYDVIGTASESSKNYRNIGP